MSLTLNIGDNSVLLRLREKSGYTSSYYLFGAENLTTNNTTYFLSNPYEDTYYYSKFTFSVVSITGSTGLTNGIVYLQEGDYYLNVYDTQYQYNLNPASASSLLTKTDMYVNITTEEEFYNSYSYNPTFSYFNENDY